MCIYNDAILLVAMVFMMSLVISNKLLMAAFQLFSTSFEPSDITVAIRMIMTTISCHDEFQVQKEDFDC